MNERERELMALFIVGAALGFVAISIVEAWVIASDLADRARIREELARFYAELDRGGDLDQAAELPEGSTRAARIDAGGATVQNFTETANQAAT